MSEISDVVVRFHRTLLDEIRERRPEYLSEPFTVAEIYQNLVPYGSHRDILGVEMNGDYEDALLRLLAGEGSYLILESGPALRALREELESSNPNTGLYREFAAVDVRLNPAQIPGGGGWRFAEEPVPAVVEDLPVSVADLAPVVEEPRAETVQHVPAAGAGEVPDACKWCRAELPKRTDLNFCPFCGTDVHLVPCPVCSHELEPEWRFCIACGSEVAP